MLVEQEGHSGTQPHSAQPMTRLLPRRLRNKIACFPFSSVSISSLSSCGPMTPVRPSRASPRISEMSTSGSPVPRKRSVSRNTGYLPCFAP